MMVLIVQHHRPKPGKKITISEAAELFNTMNSYAGTYSYNDKKITHHVEISWNQKWSGTLQIRNYQFVKNQLILSLPPMQDTSSHQQVIDSLTWEKIN